MTLRINRLAHMKVIQNRIHCPPDEIKVIPDRIHCPPGEIKVIEDHFFLIRDHLNVIRQVVKAGLGSLRRQSRASSNPGTAPVSSSACAQATSSSAREHVIDGGSTISAPHRAPAR